MVEINFISCGMMGDFIHSLSAVKNICEREQAKANIYITDRISAYGGDHWKFPIQDTFNDLQELVASQSFVNKFDFLKENFDSPFINMNNWRGTISRTHSEKGFYTDNWSEILSSSFNYNIPSEYKWLHTDRINIETKDKIVIHRSAHRHNSSFNWVNALEQIDDEIIFLTSSELEWNYFKYKSGNVKLKLVNTISEMATCINGCKLFIGNQSAPFAIASALDVNRIVELDQEPAVFYMGESKYSNNISWYLNNEQKYFNDKSIVKL